MFDIPKLLDKIGTAETVGPLIDPTLYMRQEQRLSEDRELLEAALPLHRLTARLSRPKDE